MMGRTVGLDSPDLPCSIETSVLTGCVVGAAGAVVTVAIGATGARAVVVVAGAPAEQEKTEAMDIDQALLDAFKTMSVRDAAAAVAEALNQPRRTVYARALALAKK